VNDPAGKISFIMLHTLLLSYGSQIKYSQPSRSLANYDALASEDIKQPTRCLKVVIKKSNFPFHVLSSSSFFIINSHPIPTHTPPLRCHEQTNNRPLER
tara:strand:+ start:125 stop:421 length:297 start_codon:yes stop_codon:yes gene_type:complete